MPYFSELFRLISSLTDWYGNAYILKEIIYHPFNSFHRPLETTEVTPGVQVPEAQTK